MADQNSSASKSAKKNRRRRGKKDGSNIDTDNSGFAKPVPTVDPIEDLRQKLSEAKLAKNHEVANRLRQQLWIAQDLSAGIEPNVSAEDADTIALVEEVKKYGIGPSSKEPTKETQSSTVIVAHDDADAKKLKSLKKKLTQIEKLKERQKKGEKLETNQLEKIKSENELKEEIKHLEELLSIPLKL